MLDLLESLMGAVAARGLHAEIRHVDTWSERLAVRNGDVSEADETSRRGFGVRVRAGSGWAFAAAPGDDRAAAEDALRRALALADAHPPAPPAPLTAEPPARGSWRSECVVDPRTVSLEEKLSLLAEAEDLLHAERAIAVGRARAQSRVETRLLASTDGARCEQTATACGAGIDATAARGHETQVRSHPGSEAGHVGQLGWEHVVGLELARHAPRVAQEAAALLDAPRCPEGPTALILRGEQLAIQIHESIGHAVELDRVLGGEASYAGTSFVGPGDAGRLRLGSPRMSITADATLPGALGSFGWDDEGVAARAIPIVREGVLTGFLSSRESAAAIGLERSGGCVRAEGYARQPIVRMTNVSLDPGDAGGLDDLVAATDHGLLMDTNRSWSIDSRRLHFQFGAEAAWEIRGGRIERMVRDPVYAGTTPAFWGGLDAVCSADEWALSSLTTCGKGEPGQVAAVSHGGAPARFAGVAVGSG